MPVVAGRYTLATPICQFLTRRGYGRRALKDAGVFLGDSGLLVLLRIVTYSDRIDGSIPITTWSDKSWESNCRTFSASLSNAP